MEQSASIVKLTVAMIKAQKEIKVVEKSAENPFFHSKYADLPAIFKEYQRVFLNHGLVVVQIPEGKGLRTTIAHESGEFMSGTAELLFTKQDPQGMGSAITYMRRYALASICGIVAEAEDDDGNTASQPTKQATTGPSRPQARSAAAMSPSGPNAVKSVIGKVSRHVVPEEGKEWHKFYVKDVELSTKDQLLIGQMEDVLTNNNDVEVAYTEVIQGRYTNRYIKGVAVVEEVGF